MMHEIARPESIDEFYSENVYFFMIVSVSPPSPLLLLLPSSCYLINKNKKFRSFKSKESIHKKEVGPYHGFGY